MKRYLTVLMVLAVFGLASFAAGCGGPCEKSFDRYLSCMKEAGAPKKAIKRMKKRRKKYVKRCKKRSKMRKRAKKCLKKGSCKKFIRCM